MSLHEHKLRLTDAQMDHIHAAMAGNYHMGWQTAIVEVFKCFGVNLADDACPQIRASDYAIPSDQWGQIAQWCMEGEQASDTGRVNHMLDWMNYGPSGYEPTEVPS